MKKSYYITTPIYYPNGKFHIGTAYTTILADTLKKYKAQRGFDTYMITGIDEHGQKIEDTAKGEGIEPQKFVDMQAEKAKALWKTLDINYDKFVRTTSSMHEEVVQKIFKYFKDNGDIYKGVYKGFYCKSDESYFSEIQLVDGKCPDCGKEVKIMEEESYFFNMKKYEKRLIEYYNENPDFIIPASRKNELMNSFLKDGLEDLSVSRTSFDWGIKVPGDEKHVIYVWLDALTNYITYAGYLTDDAKFNKYWPADMHIVGKDIIRFHAIYWPIFLMALDLPLPKQIYAHTWYVMKNGKMSKSKGNVVYPDDLAKRFENDVIKYVLLRELPYGNDGIFTPEVFVSRYNTDLCNDLSNLVHRTLGMIKKYDLLLSKDELNSVKDINGEYEKELNQYMLNAKENFEENMETIKMQLALEKLWEGISSINKYIDNKKPWELNKEGNREELKIFIYNLLNALRKASILVKPILSDTHNKINDILGFDEKIVTYNEENFNNVVFDIKCKLDSKPIFERMNEEDEEFIKSLMPN